MKPGKNGTGPPVIRYGSGPTPVGPVLVGFTQRGLCALQLMADGDLPAAVAELRHKYPRAELVADARAAESLLWQVCAVLEGTQEASAVPLDMQGTPFQQRVWKALLQVPRGTTWSYSQLARKAGHPRAVRAVASCCARNPIGLIVPCHRI